MGPILGAVLAAGLYEYLYCPDPEMKKKLKQVFQKDSAGRYREVETDELPVKVGSVHAVCDVEKAEKKGAFGDTPGEVLSSV